jgi:PadR family transcriptional regulator
VVGVDTVNGESGRARAFDGTRKAAVAHRDEMARGFFLGFIKIHILHHAAEEAVYGLALISELRRHGYELSPGKMYPVLHELEEARYLRRVDRVVNGKVRKYYTITRQGMAALADARKKIQELVGELLEGDAPARGTKPGRASIPGKQRPSRAP